MKIRTDFVTNSSSSSFVANLRITMADGTVFDAESYVDEYDGPSFNPDIRLEKLSKAQNVEELMNILEKEALKGTGSYDESFEEDADDCEEENDEEADELNDEDYEEDDMDYDECDEGDSYDPEKLKEKMQKLKDVVLAKTVDIRDIRSVSVTTGETLGGEFVEPIVDVLLYEAAGIDMYSNDPEEKTINQLSYEEIEERVRNSFWAKNKKEDHIIRAINVLAGKSQKYNSNGNLSRGERMTYIIDENRIERQAFFLDEDIPDDNKTLQHLIDGEK